jgi:hypothetical protein
MVLAMASACAVLALHAVGVFIKGFLLGGRERGVQRLGGVATAVGLGVALGAQGTHAVDALGRGQLGHVLGVQAGVAPAWLHGLGEGVPGAFLCSGDLQLVFEGGQVLGAALLHPGHIGGVAHVLAVVHGVAGRWGSGCARAGGGGCAGRWLGQCGQGQNAQCGGSRSSSKAVGKKGHGEILSGKCGRQRHCTSGDRQCAARVYRRHDRRDEAV